MKYGLIGMPLGHSFSKEVHAQLGNNEYVLHELAQSELADFMQERNFVGINVTIPYKEAVIPFMDELSESAALIGAVNTVVNKQGKLYGDNTDFYGMKRLSERLGLNFSGKKVAILGTGGTSKTARALAQHLGAACVLRVSRSAKEDAISYDDLYAYHADSAILINTTPCGMYPHADEAPVDIHKFTQLEGVIDAIYNPLETRLVRAARERGIAAEGGLYMLVGQALRAAELFFDTSYEASKLDEVFLTLYEQKCAEARLAKGEACAAHNAVQNTATRGRVVRIFPSTAHGSCVVPPSKSMAHRLLLCAGLGTGKSVVSGLDACEDVLATIDCLRALGTHVDYNPESGVATVWGSRIAARTQEAHLSCRESGSTLRFFVPLCMLSSAPAWLSGTKKLISRPLKPYEAICNERGLRFEVPAIAPEEATGSEYAELFVQGRLSAGTYTLPGNVSSQFITGLLFALPLLSGDSSIELTTPVESRSYIDMTLQAMAMFGVRATWRTPTCLSIPGNQEYVSLNVHVEGDYSNAAFLDAFNQLNGRVQLEGLSEYSLQGDKVYKDYFKQLNMGCPTLDLSDCPDLAPVLFVLAALKHGAHFTGTSRLALKECDRGKAMAQELAKIGVMIECGENEITVPACENLLALHERAVVGTAHVPQLCGHNDHRIVMALCVLASVTGGVIDDAQAVAKSFPGFFDVLSKLQIKVSFDGMDI